MRKKTSKCCSTSTGDLCTPYYSVVYEELLAEQVSSHLHDMLKNVASERAKAICKPYLDVIENHEKQLKNTSDGHDNVNIAVSEAWRNISAFDFYATKTERQADSRAGSEMGESAMNSNQSSGQGGSEVSALCVSP